ncbi:N-methyl-L-tryptophan oxidase [bacterium]|nr:N-methyl-L-tryptophan oxidase [bacterium]
MHYDVIVAGMGIHGLMTTYMLARRGLKVVALEPEMVGHDLGSSHGMTRVHRRAYFEAPFYVPLLKRADEIWQQLADEWELPVLSRTGVLVIGPDDGRLASGSLASAREHGIPVDVMSPDEAMLRWSGLHIPQDHVAIFEPEGGVLQVEQVLHRLKLMAGSMGAKFMEGCGLVRWEAGPDGVKVRHEQKDPLIEAGWLVLATGANLVETCRLDLPLQVERQYQVVFRPKQHGLYSASDFPAIAIDRGDELMTYGIPDFGNGVKLAFHHGGRSGIPDRDGRVVTEMEVNRLREVASEWLPQACGEVTGKWTCLYTNTPDEQFIIDWHLASRRVLLLSCCSGHGYKFGPVVGEIAAQMIADGGSSHDISEFRIGRFTGN